MMYFYHFISRIMFNTPSVIYLKRYSNIDSKRKTRRMISQPFFTDSCQLFESSYIFSLRLTITCGNLYFGFKIQTHIPGNQ